MGSESLIDKYNRERALWDKMASEIVSRFEEEELTIKDAKNVLDLVVIKIEASKVSPRSVRSVDRLTKARMAKGWFHEPCFIKYQKGHRVLLAQSECRSVWLVLS